MLLASGGAAASTAARARPVPPCATPALRASFADEQGTPGHYHAVLVLANVTPRPCMLDGYVGVELLDAAGRPLPTTPEHRDAAPPRPTVLTRRARAAVALTWVEISSGEPCVQPDRLAVTPPGRADAIVVAWPVPGSPVCGGGLIDSGPVTARRSAPS